MINGIISLTVENIKKIKALTIRPKGDFVEITGRNGQGKSTVLDAIWWALKGKDNIQTAPIRNGEQSGRIVLEISDHIIERTFRRDQLGDDYTTKIAVLTKDKARMASPQAVLDAFTGMLGFDPLAFMRQNPKQQYDTLRGLCKLEVDVEELERKYKDLFEQRTEVNRDIKACEMRLARMELPVNAPTERVDVSALVDTVQEITQQNAEIARKQRERQQFLAKKTEHAEEVKRLQARLAVLVKEDEQADGLIKEITQFLLDHKAQDTQFYSEKIKMAEQINSVMDLRDNRHMEEKELRAATAKAAEMTRKMAQLTEQKRAAIESAKLPVQGLDFGEGELLLNSVPLAQLSASEQLKLSMDIAIAENPKLKVILLKDASLLDNNSMEYIRHRAAQSGYQIWAECVASDGDIGFVIEDGELKKTERK